MDEPVGVDLEKGEARRWGSPSVQARMLLVFVPMLILIAVQLAYATRQAALIHADLAKLTEEEREAELAQALLVELRGAEVWTRRDATGVAEDAVLADLTQHLALAAEQVVQLDAAFGEGPSDPHHEDREKRLRGGLAETIADIAARAPSAPDWEPFVARLAAARRQVEVLFIETRNEAMRVAAHLDRSVQRLVDMLFLLGLVGAATLVALVGTFRRVVLQPLRAIEEATDRLGRGATTGPVAVHSRDEFGRLARTFDAMADRIEAHRRELEQRVEERTREVIRSARLAELGTLAAGIAHEINNPLASISAGIESVRRDIGSAVPAESLQFLDLALEEAARASTIANRLLRLGRHDLGRSEPVWLQREVPDVVTMVRHLAGRSGVEIDLNVADDLPEILGDPGEWRQVLFNLLRNAIDAAPAGTRVRVEALLDAAHVVLRVTDAGPGVPNDLLDRIFEPFVTTKEPGAGTGLGLAIVEGIVRDWGGTTRVRNLEVGAEFEVRVPWPSRDALAP